MTNVFNRFKAGLMVGLSLFAAVAIALSWSDAACALPIVANLPTGNPITDGRALLRYALPIDNTDVRKLQGAIEETSDTLRVSRKRLSAIKGNLTQADRIVSARAKDLLKSVPEKQQAQGEQLVEKIRADLAEMRAGVEANDREVVWRERGEVLSLIGQLEELMVGEFPYEVPAEYSNLPQLKGRATIAIETSKGPLTAIVDGYSAPVTAGNFVDLVQRGFYDGLEFTRAEESYVLQIGDPPGKEVGFIDPNTGKYRAIPLEVLVKGDKEPTYGITLEDAGRYLAQPVLPFSAYGALALARPGENPNGGSSQFFFFLFEPELTPAGANLLDGRYAIFGFVTEGKEVLEKLKEGDKIVSARVVDGLDKLVEPRA
jgi:peptidylprolyl isomerase